ncbi:MAG TPA: hypothetical protein VLM38_05610 [Blastocatellia bacterium]|nr:hypothetical protein [Blastocatellia bacterium]
MISRAKHSFRLAVLMLLAAATLLMSGIPVSAAAKLAGQWMLTINIPEGPNSSTNRTLVLNMAVSPRNGSLHGRVAITDEAGRTVSGAWRQVGKRASIAFEMPCPGDVPCASVILLGKVKGGGFVIKNGTVIVMWDTPNDRNPALYDTSNGSFRGDRLQ